MPLSLDEVLHNPEMLTLMHLMSALMHCAVLSLTKATESMPSVLPIQAQHGTNTIACIASAQAV